MVGGGGVVGGALGQSLLTTLPVSSVQLTHIWPITAVPTHFTPPDGGGDAGGVQPFITTIPLASVQAKQTVPSGDNVLSQETIVPDSSGSLLHPRLCSLPYWSSMNLLIWVGCKSV